MCFYYAIHKNNSQKLIASKIINKNQLEIFSESNYVNGFSHPEMPIIVEQAKISQFTWGLIPQWVQNSIDAKDMQNKTLNAKSETIFEKVSFAQLITKNRCLILSSGFYEWKHINKKKYPHFISLADNSIFCMAGIWNSWQNPENKQINNTFSILTTHANELVATIHEKKRMPIIVDFDKALDWISPALSVREIQQFFNPFPSNLMKAELVNNFNTPFSASQQTLNF